MREVVHLLLGYGVEDRNLRRALEIAERQPVISVTLHPGFHGAMVLGLDGTPRRGARPIRGHQAKLYRARRGKRPGLRLISLRSQLDLASRLYFRHTDRRGHV